MNREIKFRAWDKEVKKMVEVVNIDFESEMIMNESENYINFDEFEIMQYTGLKDKNGKEIYEGDIIKSLCQVFLEDDQDALISEVYYHESYAAFYLLASNRDFEINEPLAQSIYTRIQSCWR